VCAVFVRHFFESGHHDERSLPGYQDCRTRIAVHAAQILFADSHLPLLLKNITRRRTAF
jgi:hypothetical protein